MNYSISIILLFIEIRIQLLPNRKKMFRQQQQQSNDYTLIKSLSECMQLVVWGKGKLILFKES